MGLSVSEAHHRETHLSRARMGFVRLCRPQPILPLEPPPAQSNVERALPAVDGVGCFECTDAGAELR
jgi:hypothetical protein